MTKLLHMNKCQNNIKLLTVIILLAVCTVLMLNGCTAIDRNHEGNERYEESEGKEANEINVSNEGLEGFAIYLTKDDIPVDRMEALSHVDIVDQPVIAVNDMIAYNKQTHEIELTDGAFERVSQLEVPVSGKSFVVCVDKQPIYWGAFWTPLSSLSFNGVTILKPFDSQEDRTITLGLGYPSSSFYKGEDPRSNVEVIESLEQADKLVSLSFKGYELYSWEEDDQWHFTLITGTNRTKTMEEITSESTSEAGSVPASEAGLFKVHVVGADAIKDALGGLPRGESVFWCDELHIGQVSGSESESGSDIKLELPPKQIVEDIRLYADQYGIKLAITVN